MKPQSNDNTIQHFRPKLNPSSTAVPVRHDSAQGDVRHQDVQGVGQVQVDGEHVPRPMPGQGDAHHVYMKEGMPARVPGKGGGHAQAKEEQVPPLQPAQGDAHEVHLHTEFLECFSEHCWSHHKNYEWGSLGDFVHIFNS